MNKEVNRFDITKVRKKTIAEKLGFPDKGPSVFHGMKMPKSLKTRVMRAGNKLVIKILDDNLPE